jgi:hypothetical protein
VGNRRKSNPVAQPPAVLWRFVHSFGVKFFDQVPICFHHHRPFLIILILHGERNGLKFVFWRVVRGDWTDARIPMVPVRGSRREQLTDGNLFTAQSSDMIMPPDEKICKRIIQIVR